MKPFLSIWTQRYDKYLINLALHVGHKSKQKKNKVLFEFWPARGVLLNYRIMCTIGGLGRHIDSGQTIG